jgi:hypothetical protein
METTELDNKEVKVISKGYDFLRQLCAFNADITAFRGNMNPISNRVAYIMHQLDTHKIAYVVDKFQPIIGVPDAEENKFAEVNIVVEIKGIDESLTTVFSAHHDVNNVASENCQDNTASVANLLDLCVRLSKNKPANNVVVCFNDSEEKVNPMTCGIQRLAQNILKGIYGKVKYVVVLELTANGKNYWMSYRNENALSQRIREIQPTTHRVGTPYNDSMVIEKYIPSVCIGSLDDNNLTQTKTRGFCRTWAMCHRMEDTFESQAGEGDMDLFVNYLESLI